MKISESQLIKLFAIAKETTLHIYDVRLFGNIPYKERCELIKQIESQQDDTLVEISPMTDKYLDKEIEEQQNKYLDKLLYQKKLNKEEEFWAMEKDMKENSKKG